MTDDYDPQYDEPRPDNPIARPTTYTVTCLPEDELEASSWALTVEWRGRGLWAVKHGSFCLSRTFEWDYEMRPSAREDEWLRAHRFTLEEALDYAKRAAPQVIVNGFTPADLLAWRAAGCPRPIPRPHSRARDGQTGTSAPQSDGIG